MDGINENVIEFLRNEDTATVTLSQARYINKIRALADARPEECQILAENQDGSIVAHIPTSWVKISPPRTREISEEEMEILRERILKAREKHSENTSARKEKEPDDGSAECSD